MRRILLELSFGFHSLYDFEAFVEPQTTAHSIILWLELKNHQVHEDYTASGHLPSDVCSKLNEIQEAYTFSRTMPLAWDAPAKGLAFQRVPKWAFL